MINYLKETKIIDFSDPQIQTLAEKLAQNSMSELETVKNCFLYVRDNIRHSGDCKVNQATSKASEVLKYKTGWCYAKSHLLAALVRANGIPTGFCYQRLRCSEYKDNVYCLHGLNAVYLKDFGWYRVDARGNKEGVRAEFEPPVERLAFSLEADETDIEGIFEDPLSNVLIALEKNKTYEEMINNFPDI